MIVLGLQSVSTCSSLERPGLASSVVWQIAARTGIPVFDVGCKLTTGP